MAQFYFLAVLLNIICGLICVYENKGFSDDFSDDFSDEFEDDFGEGGEEPKKRMPGIGKIQEGIAGESLFANPTFNFVAGALCFITGFVILFAPYKGPSVIGDLLPALAALLGGGSVLLSYFENNSDSFSVPEILDTILITNKLYVGIFCLLFGVVHFIVPGAPVL